MFSPGFCRTRDINAKIHYNWDNIRQKQRKDNVNILRIEQEFFYDLF